MKTEILDAKEKKSQMLNVDESDIELVRTLLRLREGIQFGEIVLRFEGGRCTHQKRTDSHRIVC